MRRLLEPARLTAIAIYATLLAATLAEKAGQTTSDTKASLMTAPGELLHSTFSLWNPQVSLGELQNQAYGYLFPMGPFFTVLHALGSPDWVTERLWSFAVVLVACEGARLVARQLGLGAWAALGAGLAYGLNVRIVSEIGIRSAEVLPGAVLPWALLPVLWVLRGRISTRSGALLSAAAFLFFGAVNGTATIAPLPLVVVFIVWGCRRGLAGWSLLGWWAGFMALVSIWWGSSLLQLSAFSPPFFDYVEDAPTTTSTGAYDPAVRGASNWVGYLSTGDKPSWPSAWALDYRPTLVLATGLLAAVSVVGLALFRSSWRTPLAISAIVGLVCLTIGHTSQVWLQSPLGPSVQASLDHPFALLRNIAKVDPVLRLPLAVGFGVALGLLGDRARAFLARSARRRAGLVRTAAVLACATVLVGAQPVLALNTRTPGWDKIPSYWTQAADYLAAQPGDNRAWVVPGTGFGIQTWGWTMDETMSMIQKSPWVTRSQVPLVNAETIRMLSGLEDVLDTGAGSAQLGTMLERIGLGHVVLRHDLDPQLADAVPSSVVSIALARSSGIKRVATFGNLRGAPAIEIFEAIGRDRTQSSDLRVLPTSTAVTVSSGPADVLTSVGAGLIPADRAAVVAGDNGWSKPAEVLGDGYQDRERQFGRVHEAEGPVLAPGEPRRSIRRFENYPGSTTAKPVVARYTGVRYVDASSSQGFVDSFGPIRSENAPFSAVDGDPKTAWTTSYLSRPLNQWLAVHYGRTRTVGTVTVHGDPDPSGRGVRAWKVRVGTRTVVAKVDPFTGEATADLGGARGSVLRISVASVGNHNRRAQISVREIGATGLPAVRTLVVPRVPGAAGQAYVLTDQPESRACVPTLLSPDCDPNRYRPAEDPAGIDRLVSFSGSGGWNLYGTVVAKADPATIALLDPLGSPVVMRASSTYLDDPTVSARMAYDGTPTTSWIADPNDPSPTLTVDFTKPRRLDRLTVAPPADPGVAPTGATITAGSETRHVDLGEFGTFAPLVASHVEISFDNPTRGSDPLGVGEVQLSGVPAVPLDGAARTGAYCGYGPNVYVDGHRYPTKVEGLMGDVSSSGPLSVTLCDGLMPIGAGEHRIRIASTNQFQPVRIVVARPDALAAGSTTPRALTVRSDGRTRQTAEVAGGASSLLVTGRNWNPGWKATLDGHELTAQRIDGWAQGWRLPAGGGGTITITFAPQRPYLVGLVAGLVIAGSVLLLALVLLLRTRLLPGTDPAAALRPRRRGRAGVLATVAVVGTGWVLGGLPALVGAALAQLPRGRRVLVALAGVLVASGSAVTALEFAVHGAGLVPGASSVVTGIGVTLGLVLALRDVPDADT
ncbi:MAG: alpha-(1-_3)-arabinofuranosyltransferase family protein [Marmoricola sp.]